MSRRRACGGRQETLSFQLTIQLQTYTLGPFPKSCNTNTEACEHHRTCWVEGAESVKGKGLVRSTRRTQIVG